jgi:hypothetical protein
MFFFIYNLNQQSELCLLQCLDGGVVPGTSNQVNWPVSFESSVLFSCFEERVSVGFECSVMIVAFLVDDLMYV